MKLWYLAHPVKADHLYTLEQNLEHARKIQSILWDHGVAAIMPWYSFVISYGQGEGDQLVRCLEMDCEVVKKCGNIILSGHRISSGMAIEHNALADLQPTYGLLNLVGFKDVHVPVIIKERMEDLI